MEKLTDKIKEILDIFEQRELKYGENHPCYELLKKMAETINIRWLGKTQDVSDRCKPADGEEAAYYDDLVRLRWEYVDKASDKYTIYLDRYKKELPGIISGDITTPTETQKDMVDLGESLRLLRFQPADDLVTRSYSQAIIMFARYKEKPK